MEMHVALHFLVVLFKCTKHVHIAINSDPPLGVYHSQTLHPQTCLAD